MAYTMMSIPQLVDGLGREHLEVVDKALLLHKRVFRKEFIINLVEGNAMVVEEHIRKMAILFESILNFISNAKRNTTFVKNLLDHTLDHLHFLLNALETLDCKSSLQQQEKAVQELFLFYINELNAIQSKVCGNQSGSIVELNKSSVKGDRKIVPVSQILPSPSNKALLGSLETKTNEEVIREALLDRDAITRARETLRSRQYDNLDDIQSSFESVATSYVSELLMKRQIETAKDVLWNLDKDVWPALKDICMNTTNESIRDYLAFELKFHALLDEAELDAWKYLILVGGIAKTSKINIVANSCGNLSVLKGEQPKEEDCAVNLSISQLLSLSSEKDVKIEFLMELFFETQDLTLEPMLEKEKCWRFLLNHSRMKDLICWIIASSEPTNSSLRCSSRLESFLSMWNITQEMVDAIAEVQYHSFLKDKLLDLLSRYDVYTTTEATNPHKLLLREARNGNLSCALKDVVKGQLVQFCLKNDIPELLISCELTVEKGLSDWTDLYSDYLHYCASQDSKILLKSIIRLAQFFQLSTMTDPWIPLTFVILSLKPLSDALLEDSNLICDTLNVIVCKTDLHASLNSHPKLEALLGMNSGCNLTEDITALQLLKDCSTLNIRHGQPICSLFREGLDDTLHHFREQQLISSFGHHETLDYHYYLKQSRPCFAACVVLAEQFLNSGGPSRQLLKKACISAHWLAISHFNNPKVTAACIAFIEMLGGVSTALRCHLAVVNLFSSAMPTEENAVNHEGNIVLLLKGLSSEDHLRKAEIVSKVLERHLQQDVLAQGLIVKLSALHHLPYPKGFLFQCAKKNDWIQFTLFCQLYNTPLSLVGTVSRQFQSVALKKHMQMFLNRVHHRSLPQKFHAEASSDQSSLKTKKSEVYIHSVLSQSFLDTYFAENLSVLDDLFEVIWLCHQTADPHTALLSSCLNLPCPVLAVIADCYQAKSLLHFCVWLASWFSLDERAKCVMFLENKQLSVQDVEFVIFQSLKCGIDNLHTAFNIFLPKHPLVLIVDVVCSISNSKGNENAFNWLLDFHEACQEMGLKTDAPFASDGSYILSLGHKILFNTLELPFLSAASKNYLVKVIFQTNVFLEFDGRTTDLRLLLDLMNILSMSEVQIDVKSFLQEPLIEINRYINELINLKDFKRARSLASISGVKEGFIILAEETNNFLSWLATPCQDFKTFCLHCNHLFEDADIEPVSAFHFFEFCASNLINHLDRWRALRSCHNWLSLCSPSNETQETELKKLEIEIWNCLLKQDHSLSLHQLDEEFDYTPLSMLTCQLLRIDCHLSNQTLTRPSSPQNTRLVDLISHLLDIGDIASACRVRFLFGVNTMDLAILETCICLAEGKIDTTDARDCYKNTLSFNLTDSGHTPIYFSADKIEGETTTPKTKSGGSTSFESMDPVNIACTIRAFCKLLKHGQQIGKQLLACSQLSLSLHLSHQEVSQVVEPLQFLRMALSEDGLNNFSIASDILNALNLTPLNCAQFLSREIIAAISKSCSQDNGQARDCTMWGYNIESHFSRILELAPDPCLLGTELIHFATRLTSSDKKLTKEVLSTSVELLVRAHDCYSAGCHMEGIIHVLRSVSKLVLVLKSRAEWALMVRLLTGIQRYTEMSYIFKLLKENDQFEYLLRKDSIKPSGFKAALLEWLRWQCPDDPSLLKMIAAYFKMQKQEAALWESEGRKRLEVLVAKGLQNNSHTKEILQTALQDYSHAAECYLQADMFNHALVSAHQAELIALQLHIVSSSDKQIQCILFLDPKTVAKLITSTLSFHQAQIVGRAYNHRIDWGAALYYHCISPGLRGEEYFSAWSAAMEFTPALMQDLAHRFQRTQVATREMATNICYLLSHLQDMDVRYKIASELGLKEFVQDLLQAPEVAYLKDTVWQSGFKM